MRRDAWWFQPAAVFVILTSFSSGVFASRAVVPEMRWKTERGTH